MGFATTNVFDVMINYYELMATGLRNQVPYLRHANDIRTEKDQKILEEAIVYDRAADLMRKISGVREVSIDF